jgi:S1-C subfamily serine protease
VEIRSSSSQGLSISASGVVLTSDGEVLTTNDAISGSSSIRVTVPGTSRTYRAEVAGYDVTADVAVLELDHAEHLHVARLGNAALVAAGQAVTAYGGSAFAAGHVLVTHQDFIEENPDGSNGLRLPDLLSDDAPAPPSFTGGPLVNGSGRVIGINVLGVVEAGVRPTGLQAAIPIDRARSTVAAIAARRSSPAIHVGPTAMLGIAVAPGDLYQGLTTGVTVQAVLPSSPFRRTGLGPGDIIQSLGGQQVSSPTDLTTFLLSAKPGELVDLEWVGSSGGVHSAQVRLAAGPPF